MVFIRIIGFILRTVLGSVGCGVRMLDYRKVEEQIYDVTQWLTVFFLPVVPLGTLRIRPKGEQTLNMGAVIQTKHDFDLLSTGAIGSSRALRIYFWGWLLGPALTLGPIIGAIAFARRVDGGAPSPLKTVILLFAAIWATVVLGIMNRRREKVWEAVATSRPA